MWLLCKVPLVKRWNAWDFVGGLSVSMQKVRVLLSPSNERGAFYSSPFLPPIHQSYHQPINTNVPQQNALHVPPDHRFVEFFNL